jgi:hypothetical protein
MILQDADLTQKFGQYLIYLLLLMARAEQCLGTIARLGNPREVILEVIEALQTLSLDLDDLGEADNGTSDTLQPAKAMEVDKFCILVNLLSILHLRIQTLFPSRFLSTSLVAILYTYQLSN